MSTAKKREGAPEEKQDRRVLEVLAAIDRKRIADGIKSLEELTWRARHPDAGRKPRPNEMPANASTWHGWRDGSRSPKFVDLADFAEAVGLYVGVIDYVPPHQQQGADAMTTEAKRLLGIYRRLSAEEQAALMSKAFELLEGGANFEELNED